MILYNIGLLHFFLREKKLLFTFSIDTSDASPEICCQVTMFENLIIAASLAFVYRPTIYSRHSIMGT